MTNVEDFGPESLESTGRGTKTGDKVELTPVSPKDVFNLGKWVLVVVAIFLMVFSVCRICLGVSDEMKDVWEFHKVFLNSVSTLILGYYFGQREKNNS